MPAYVPTASSRILEGHKDLLTFRSQLEHVRFLVLRMGGNVLSDRQGDADMPQERARSTVVAKAAVPRILDGVTSKSDPSPRRERGRTILMDPIRVCFGRL